jgi:DNA-binding transcriptional LysR family regulator
VDFKDLKYVVAVCETKSFIRASISLYTVQSNVSIRIRRLEESLDATLFVRHPRGVTPTIKGDLLYRYAKDVLGKMDEARHMVGSADAPWKPAGMFDAGAIEHVREGESNWPM